MNEVNQLLEQAWRKALEQGVVLHNVDFRYRETIGILGGRCIFEDLKYEAHSFKGEQVVKNEPKA